MLQYVPLCPGIFKTYVLKPQFSPALRQLFILRFFCIHNAAVRPQNFLNSVCCHTCTRKHDGNHRNHQKGHDDLHRIGHKRHHIANLQVSGVDSLCTEPHDHDGNAVHNQHHRRHHKGHDAVGEQLRFHQVLVRFIKPFFFEFFSGKCTDNRKPSQNFPGNQVHPVH